MLRITTYTQPGHLTFQLEGRLAGPWVLEMANCWSRVATGQRLPEIRVELSAVTNLDRAGRELLRDLHTNGAELIAADCWMKAVVAEITQPRPVVDETDVLLVPRERQKRIRRRRMPVGVKS